MAHDLRRGQISEPMAIYPQELDREVYNRVDSLPSLPRLSLLSWVELEGGIAANRQTSGQRRYNLDRLLAGLSILGVDAAIVLAYREIVGALGFSRSRIIDRLIAASAIVDEPTLIAMNGADFKNIPGLKLEIWPRPAAQ